MHKLNYDNIEIHQVLYYDQNRSIAERDGACEDCNFILILKLNGLKGKVAHFYQEFRTYYI